MTSYSTLHDGRRAPTSQPPLHRLTARWHDLSVRTQILAVFALATLLISGVAATVKIFDARQRVDNEMTAPLTLALSFIDQVTSNAETEADLRLRLASIVSDLQAMRHVRVEVLRAEAAAEPISIGAFTNRGERLRGREGEAPRWFVDLIRPDKISRRLDVTAKSGARLVSLVVYGDPADEIAEIYDDFVTLLWLWLVAISGLLIALYLILGHLLDPLEGIAQGFRALEQGDSNARVAEPRARELRYIADRFNQLARGLQKAHIENSRLCRNLISVQEEERKQIARDLHDEIGPCLFGIMTNAQSIEKFADDMSVESREQIRQRIVEIRETCDRLRATNRLLLKRLRPAALGQVNLKGLLSKLLEDLRLRHDAVRFQEIYVDLLDSYGEDIDLTIYRCIQEATNNALRHGSPASILVELKHTGARSLRSTSLSLLELRIIDDGIGMPPAMPTGFGQATMRERIMTLGGTFKLTDNWPSGAIVSATIPLNRADAEPLKA